MQYPRIHLNGTSGTVLLSEHDRALKALDRALKALGEVTVHGRDYYVISNQACQNAFLEHRQRIKDVTRVRDEIEQITLDIAAQITGRAA